MNGASGSLWGGAGMSYQLFLDIEFDFKTSEAGSITSFDVPLTFLDVLSAHGIILFGLLPVNSGPFHGIR